MSDRPSLTTDLTTGSVAKQLLRFSWPIMLSNLFQTVYNLVDMVIVGRFVGSDGLAAVGIGAQIMLLFLSVGMSFGHAGQILISQQLGAGDRDGLGYSTGTVFLVEAVSGLALGALCLLLCNPVLAVMNTPAEALASARSYTRICGCGMLFIYGYNAVSAVLRGLGDSRLPMVMIAVAEVINVILDLLFVAGLGMGAGGAALATVISQGVCFLGSVAYLYARRGSLGFAFTARHLRVRRRNLKALMKLGLPLLAQELLITVSMTYINAMVNAYGVTAAAVDAVGSKLTNVLYIGIDGMAVGSGAMIGQCFGARNFDRIRKICNTSLVISLLLCTALCALLVLFPAQIFRLFTSDEAVIAMAPSYMWVVVVYAFVAVSMVGPFSVVEGVGNATLAMIISIADGVVARIGLGYLMGSLFGLYGYWFGSASAGLVTTLLAGIYYLSGRWKTRRPVIEADRPATLPDPEADVHY